MFTDILYKDNHHDIISKNQKLGGSPQMPNNRALIR